MFDGGLERGVRLLKPDETMTPLPPPAGSVPSLGLAPGQPLDTVRLAIVDGDARQLKDMEHRAAPYEIVQANAKPDLVWSARSHEVKSGGEILAYGVDPTDLPSVIDRAAAVRQLQQMATGRSQPMRLGSGSAPQRGNEQVDIEIGDINGRALVLFDLSGDGTVQALYPLGSDDRIVHTQTYHLVLQTREPFGTDLIVAITAPQAMDDLEQGLKQLSHYRSASEVLNLIRTAAPRDARIGLVPLSILPDR